MKREPEEYRGTKEQRRAEREERRAQRRRADEAREMLPFTMFLWAFQVLNYAKPLSEAAMPQLVLITFGIVLLVTVGAAVCDFVKTGFTEKSWLTFIVDAILMVISVVTMAG